MEQENKKNFKAVFTVVEGKDGREHWVRLGAAFENHDGSLTVRLNAVPTNGKLIIREPRSFDDRPGGSRNGGGRSNGSVRVHGREDVSGRRASR